MPSTSSGTEPAGESQPDKAAPERPGIYRRHIRIRSLKTPDDRDGGIAAVRADMEDDPHRFGVIVRHDGQRVVSVEGLPYRTPWSLCPEAAPALQGLVGMTLSPDPLAAAKVIDAKQQCTHMFDLASLAIAHAARGTALREYAIEAPWYAFDEPRTLTLRRDGAVLWVWKMENDRLVSPCPYADHDVRRMMAWAETAITDPDEREALFIMRRAVMISGSRIMDLDRFANAAAVGHGLGACYVYQPGRNTQAVRVMGSTRDFTARPDAPLADLASEI